MNLDFPTILVLGALFTGGVWLVDAVVSRRRGLSAAAGGDSLRSETVAERRKEPLLVEYSKSFFPVILIVLVLRSFLVEPFRIPSGSMTPTLLDGDFILVNKFAYGIRLPVIDRKIIDIGMPQRGDVVVFRYPRDTSFDYIKRIVGEPGDRIHYTNKTLYVNGKPATQDPVGPYIGDGSSSRETGKLESVEDLDGIKHAILVHPLAPNFPPGCHVLDGNRDYTVPDGHYFVMGDNRDNSNDSRCWGVVPDRLLVGKAFAIWMHWDSNRAGFPVGWSRIGNRIE